MQKNPEKGSRPGICTPVQQLATPPAQSETHKGATICDDLSVVAKVRGAAATRPSQKILKCVGHEASIVSLRHKGVLWSHSLKAHKAEGTEQSGSLIMVLVEANEDMVSMQLLLCKLELRSCLCFPGQSTTWDLNVEAAAAQHCSLDICEPSLDIENSHLVIFYYYFLKIYFIDFLQRGR
uniref:Uncharacterized protein n=1 Tax=Pipistrellus kuhlii TaxID=59472 RepID=A0A7J7ZK19_PIPKU|nr:hypothetical protein mPipKuh1_009519 [Pipistrellus kuhlii]